MAKDYKYRVQNKQSLSYRKKPESLSLWRWMLITVLIISFVVFVVRTIVSFQSAPSVPVAQVTSPTKLPEVAEKVEEAKPEKAPEPAPVLPQFDFYTILPEKEVIVPDYEINTRTREERVGQAKAASYILQAGSFKDFDDADNLRAKLAAMGIESKVEKAKVGSVIWNRVKMGPFTQITSVNTIRSRLRENGIDVIVTEIGG